MKGKEWRWKQRKQKKNRGVWRGSENSNVFIEKITIPHFRTLTVKGGRFPRGREKWNSYLTDTK